MNIHGTAHHYEYAGDDTWSNVWLAFSNGLRIRKLDVLMYGINDANHSFINTRSGGQYIVKETVDEIDVMLDRSVSNAV